MTDKATHARVAELYLYDTCTMKCGYCWLAESGRVLDSSQLAPFRRPEFIDQIAGFFNSRSGPDERWLIQLTGGEPLVMPNLGRFCDLLFEGGQSVAMYTSLFVDQGQANFQYVLQNAAGFDYVMASLHPEAEVNEAAFLHKLELLKKAGLKLFLRFVGHPARLHRLEELARRSEELDVCFYPTALLTPSYPGAYTDGERSRLSGHFTSLSQFIQLQGGVDTRSTRCLAGNRVIAVNMQTGNITPCISVTKPTIGNIFSDRLELSSSAMACPEPGVSCICDVHYQQNIVIGAPDANRFEELKRGYNSPRNFDDQLQAMPARGLKFCESARAGIGNVADEQKLYYSIQETKENARRVGPPRKQQRDFVSGEEITGLLKLRDLIVCNSANVSGKNPIRVVTPKEP